VHVADVVRANLAALDSDAANGRVYNVGTGAPTSVLQVAELLAKELGFSEPPEISEKFRAGDIRHCYGDDARGGGARLPAARSPRGRGRVAGLAAQSAETASGAAASWRAGPGALMATPTRRLGKLIDAFPPPACW
jgi:hypothetical protein